MSKDGLRRLPDHVVAPLLRALMTIPRTPDSRLILRKAESGRPPSWDATTDFDVIFRDWRIGRVWFFDYTGKSSGDMARYLWHWYWRDIDGRRDTEGHAPSLQAAMADFRRAWDMPGPNIVNLK